MHVINEGRGTGAGGQRGTGAHVVKNPDGVRTVFEFDPGADAEQRGIGLACGAAVMAPHGVEGEMVEPGRVRLSCDGILTVEVGGGAAVDVWKDDGGRVIMRWRLVDGSGAERGHERMLTQEERARILNVLGWSEPGVGSTPSTEEGAAPRALPGVETPGNISCALAGEEGKRTNQRSAAVPSMISFKSCEPGTEYEVYREGQRIIVRETWERDGSNFGHERSVMVGDVPQLAAALLKLAGEPGRSHGDAPPPRKRSPGATFPGVETPGNTSCAEAAKRGALAGEERAEDKKSVGWLRCSHPGCVFRCRADCTGYRRTLDCRHTDPLVPCEGPDKEPRWTRATGSEVLESAKREANSAHPDSDVRCSVFGVRSLGHCPLPDSASSSPRGGA